MLLLVLTGRVGTAIHIADNLTTTGQFVVERFIRGAPVSGAAIVLEYGATRPDSAPRSQGTPLA